MKEKSILLVLFAILIITSCKFTNNKEIVSSELKIIPIERESYKTYTYNIVKKRKELNIREKVLVINPPVDKDNLIKIMLKYRKEYGQVINDSCFFYSMSFYKYTDATSYNTNNETKTDAWGEKYSLDDQKQDLLGIIYNEHSPIDSLKWMISVAIAYKVQVSDKYNRDLNANIFVLDSCSSNYHLINKEE